MASSAKEKVRYFATLIVAAVLGAAMWEGISSLVAPAYARDFPDPRNVTAMRMEQLKETATINENLVALREYLEQGKLEVTAEVKMDKSRTTKKNTTASRAPGKSEIEIKRD